MAIYCGGTSHYTWRPSIQTDRFAATAPTPCDLHKS